MKSDFARGGWLPGAVCVLALMASGGCADEAGQETFIDRTAMEEELPEAALGQRTPVEIKTATCNLHPGGYRGPCAFEPRGRGSFAVTREDGRAFYGQVDEILVTVFQPGRADVRSFAGGRSAMLGEAVRSEDYPACWLGKDFSVCAY